MSRPLPLAYSCSGCSSAAQLANHLAVRLDRAGQVEMSCIAGVGGGVSSLVRKALDAAASGRPILAIDGCALACTRASLARHGVRPTAHVQLGTLGVRKAYHADFDPQQADELYARLAEQSQAMSQLHAAKREGEGGGCACAEARRRAEEAQGSSPRRRAPHPGRGHA
ncbi:MAG: putative zinc-binding protein [Burkholderiales bacterium]|nr:putative zinc-binding protein [Burkholderiales bacterium]MCH2241480.1 putative zinc-binding protein [Aquabacterium sp.]